MSKTLYVGNVSWGTTEEKVRELFAQYGPVLSVRWITDRETGRFRGFCFVEMDDANAAKAIAALNEYEYDGRALRVNEAEERLDRRVAATVVAAVAAVAADAVAVATATATGANAILLVR